jgi:hypothetical protein
MYDDLGQLHGITINRDYESGKTFYRYVTQQQSKFSVLMLDVDLPPIGIWAYTKTRDFMRGVLDEVEYQWSLSGEVTKIYIEFATAIGYTEQLRGYAEDFLWAIGPARKGLYGFGIGGEWAEWGEQTPPKTYEEAMAMLQPFIDLAHKYGYKFGNVGVDVLLSKANLPSQIINQVIDSLDFHIEIIWIPYRQSIEDTASLTKTYQTFRDRMLNSRPNTVGCYAYIENTARGAQDGVAPWYLTADVFDSVFAGLDEVWRQRPNVLKLGVVFPFSYYTYNDCPGWSGHSSTLEWLFQNPNLAEKHLLRTSEYPEPRETYPTITLPNPFPPYPTAVFAGAPRPPPPWALAPGIPFGVNAYTLKLYDGTGLNGEAIDVYIKDPTGVNHKVGSLTSVGSSATGSIITPQLPVYGRGFMFVAYAGNPDKGLLPAPGASTYEPLLYVSEVNKLKLDTINLATGEHLPIENGLPAEESYTKIVLWISIGIPNGKIEGMGDKGQVGPTEGWAPYKAPQALPDTSNPVTFTIKVLFPSPVYIDGKFYKLVKVWDDSGKEYPIIPNILTGNREYGHMPGIEYIADAPRSLFGGYVEVPTHRVRIESKPISVTLTIDGLTAGKTPYEADMMEKTCTVEVPSEVEA